MNILFIGDVVGRSGLDYLLEKLPSIRKEYRINFVIVNGENITKGRGLSYLEYKMLMSAGVNVVTLGNHAFGCQEIEVYAEEGNIIRPLNIETEIGKGFLTLKYNQESVTVLNLLGTTFMNVPFPVQNPFLAMDEFLKHHQSDYLIVDFHSNATSEKIAFGHYFDGRATAILGTHTHVPTADERQLPKGTLYITDVGMTGPYNGVIGMDAKIIIDRFVHDSKTAFQLAEGPKQLNGVVLQLPLKKIIRIHEHE